MARSDMEAVFRDLLNDDPIRAINRVNGMTGAELGECLAVADMAAAFVRAALAREHRAIIRKQNANAKESTDGT